MLKIEDFFLLPIAMIISLVWCSFINYLCHDRVFFTSNDVFISIIGPIIGCVMYNWYKS